MCFKIAFLNLLKPGSVTKFLIPQTESFPEKKVKLSLCSSNAACFLPALLIIYNQLELDQQLL